MAGLQGGLATMASPYGVLQNQGMPSLPSLAMPMPTPSAGLPTAPIQAPPLTPYQAPAGGGLGSFNPPPVKAPEVMLDNRLLERLLRKQDAYMARNYRGYGGEGPGNRGGKGGHDTGGPGRDNPGGNAGSGVGPGTGGVY
jgi:hypothetical protein